MISTRRFREPSPRSVFETIEVCENMLQQPLLRDDKEAKKNEKERMKEEDLLPRMNLLDGLMGLQSTGDDLELIVGDFLRKGSFCAVILWLSLLLIIYFATPADAYEYLEGVERNSNIMLLVLLIATNGSRMLHLIVRDSSITFVKTGVMTATVIVQSIAMISISLMLYFPTPVMIDSVTGIRSHLVRWAEWTALAFLMTFLTESIDLPLQGGGTTIAWLHGAAIALSTVCGALFPFCTTWTSWLAVFTVSWVLFCSLFIRLFQRYRRFVAMTRGDTVDKKEEYDRALYSLKLIAVCTAAWTGLAVSWSVVALLAPYVQPDSMFASEWLILVTENIFEAVSKIWYGGLLIEVHNTVFDDASRTVRRLEELRNFMSAVWDTSSDVIAMCSRTEKRITGVVSPAFFKMEKPLEDSSIHSNDKNKSTMIIEVDPEDGSYRTFVINLTEPITRRDAIKIMWSVTQQKTKLPRKATTHEKNVAVMADLLREAFLSRGKETVAMKDLFGLNGNGQEFKLRCEAKITKLESSAFLLVLRDISERFQRFETEKKLIEEITARRKDAEANRFTRHEVKNGILAAIGLLDSLRDVPRRFLVEGGEAHENSGSEAESAGFDESLGELDNTLRDILDTIMDHAMSREVIYEEYEVRKERIKVPEVLSAIGRHSGAKHSRFTITTNPDPFPTLGLDPRLLRYIYQNALSNACRYGQVDGDVRTSILYDEDTKMFKMEVVNAAGDAHEQLVVMEPEEVKALVFAPGTSLHTSTEEERSVTVSGSSGDGAWIMQKCARTLKGECDIRFEKDRTVFSFLCPARAYITIENEGELLVCYDFSKLPESTWGIVIDDSGIQRKLMDRFLKVAGIQKERRIVVGKDSKEIYGFCDLIVELMKAHPDDKFLVIADENLEVVEGAALHGTVSGSLCIQKVLERLEPSEECRLLALVRSANDSVKDIERYKSRAHGYLLKAPIDKEGVLKSIKPWWIRRFPKVRKSVRNSLRPSLPRSDSFSSVESECYNPCHDITTILEVIDALCKVCDETSLQKRWRSIQDRLHTLKGDLKTVVPTTRESSEEEIKKVTTAIDDLRLGEFPEDLKERWVSLRSDIEKVIGMYK